MVDLQGEWRPERIQQKKSFWEAYGANIMTVVAMIIMGALLYWFLDRNGFQFVLGSDASPPTAQSSQSSPAGQGITAPTAPVGTISPSQYGSSPNDEQRKALEAEEVRRTGATPVR